MTADAGQHDPGGVLGSPGDGRVSRVAAEDGTPLIVEEVTPSGGDAELAVVGVHGFALSRRSWHFQRAALTALDRPHVRQVYYDHRGHGESGPADPDSSTIEQLAADLHVVIRTVAPREPIVLMGHSMGGMVIMELAQQAPELFASQVRGVALLATAAGEVGSHGLPRSLLSRKNPLTRSVGELAGWQPGIVEFVRAAGGQLTRTAVRHLAFGKHDVPSAVVSFMQEMLAVSSVKQLAGFADTFGTHNRYAALAGLKHVHTLVVGGDADRITPYSHTERIVAELPDASLLRLPGAGHMLQLEQPDEVNSHVIDLVQQCAGVTGQGQAKRKSRWWRR
ncbi:MULTISPECIES: alpha/beta fold hydrolase [Prauserella salsuginis group]|uniref:Pimeloyl-ACP methyl ester carboxylesterase n=2 Tax=Prauserella salsuginis group TaxID=2893672 RepID=A0A839XKP7_9PSEU|nr:MULTISPECIES: alpha/beta hydrolase [Prauserella salsuginis group]MBB3662094.1 pimeloyl-ACP methyl ester carboxylesterase [Prauserella sediminis]MCR3719786.1 Pimeloyl-ACP methyl ester carboxylesterase [Prauserella flava]MCR3736671.1 Pimeloyl-ACP methyl ester carboxylesterase [Prauserella salsuginis]